MRIIAGEFRHRALHTPKDAETTRPIPDRVKESVFMLLRGHCEGANVFDAFAGTGAIGLEAVSRGAGRCVFVERDRRVAEILRRNVDELGCADRCEIVVGDALGAGALARCPRPCRLVFLDPPYPVIRDPLGFRRTMDQLGALVDRLEDGGFAVLRTPWPLLHQHSTEAQLGSSRPPREDKRPKKSERWRESDWLGSGLPSDTRRTARKPRRTDAENADSDLTSPDAAEAASDTAPGEKPTLEAPSLHLANAVGPETHAYGSMAVHLYMKRPR